MNLKQPKTTNRPGLDRELASVQKYPGTAPGGELDHGLSQKFCNFGPAYISQIYGTKKIIQVPKKETFFEAKKKTKQKMEKQLVITQACIVSQYLVIE